MSDEILVDGTRYVSAAQAASACALSRDYVAKLCREGKVSGKRVGKSWYVSEDSLKGFIAEQQAAEAKRLEALAHARAEEYRNSLAKRSSLAVSADVSDTIRDTAFVSAAQAATYSGLSRDYVAKLCRENKIEGKRVGKIWYVNETSLKKFLLEQRYAEQLRIDALARARVQEYRASRESGTEQLAGSVAMIGEKISDTLMRHGGTISEALRGIPTHPGLQDAVLRIAHAPTQSATPLGEMLHKLVALATAIVLTCTAYAFVDSSYKEATLASVRSAIEDLQSEYVALVRGTEGNVAERALQALRGNVRSSVVLSASAQAALPDVFAQFARFVNNRVDSFIYAIAFPDALTRSVGSVAVEIKPYAMPRANNQQPTTNNIQATALNQRPSTVSSAGSQKSAVGSHTVERVIERTIERVVPQTITAAGGITEEYLAEKINELDNKLSSRMYSLTSANSTAIAGNYIVTAHTNKIDNLGDVDISGSRFTGGTVTDSSISATSLEVTGSATSTFAGGIDIDAGCFSINGVCVTGGGSSTGASTTLLADTNMWTGDNVFTNATSTNFFASIASSTNLFAQNASFGALSLATPLSEISGGTGQSTYDTGDILYASGANTLSRLSVGVAGQVLKVVGGVPTWSTDISGSGGGGLFATSSDDLIIHPSTPAHVLVLGASATTSTGNILEVAGNSLIRGTVTAYGAITAPAFIATSSTASVFNNASTTLATLDTVWLSGITNGVLATDGNGRIVATTSISTNLLTGALGSVNGTAFNAGSAITVSAASSSLLTDHNTFSGNNVFTNTIAGSISGNAGTATALQTGRNINGTFFDGTSDITVVAASSTLLGNNNTFSGANTFTQTITGSISGNADTATALQTGRTINGTLFDGTSNITITAASSTILADINSWTGLQNFANASSSLATITRGWATNFNAAYASSTATTISGNAYLTGLTSALLSTNASGQVIATSSIGTSLLTGTLATVNGTAVTAGGTFTISAASSTLLANDNTFSGNNTFTQTINGSVSGNAGTATALQTARNINSVSFNGTADITIFAASSTLLANNNTWTGLNQFANASTTLLSGTTAWFTSFVGSLTGNASTATALQTGRTINGTLFDGTSNISIFAASSTLLANTNNWTGLNTFSNASTTLLSGTTAWFTTINGALVGNADTATALQTGRTINGTLFDGTSNITITAASSTLLANSNTWSGLQSFANATSSLATLGATWFTGINNSILATNANGQVVATSTIGTSLLSGTLATINGTGVTAGGSATITAASSTLLGDTNTFTGTNRFSNASTSQLTATSSIWFTGIAASRLLAVDANNQVVATTSIGANLITGSLGTINGTAFNRGDSINVTAASSTLLANNNTWTGLNQFANASTTLLSGTTAWFTSFVGSLTGNASTATALQTGRTINGTLFDGTSNITITAASSSLLADSNRFTGANMFLASTTIGDGTTVGGLTVSGGATTTGSAYFSNALRVAGSLGILSVTNCSGSQALQSDGSGNISCGAIITGGASSGGGWTTDTVGNVGLSTTTDRVAIGASTTPYAKLSILSGGTATTTLALVAATAQSANIIDIYGPSGVLSTVLTSQGSLGLGTSTPGSILSIHNVGNFVASATSTLYNGLNLAGLNVTGVSTLGNTVFTNATSSAFAITSLANALLSTNANGSVVATSSIGTSLLSGSLGTINGTAFNRGDSINVTAASSTLLANNNTWTGLNQFANASTTLLSGTTAWFTSFVGSLTGNASTATALQTSRNINGVLFDGTSDITISAASSTLLANHNWWTGTNRFTQASTSQFTATSTVWFTSLASALLGVDNTGRLVATSSIGTNLLTGSLGTINGTTFNAGASITIGAASTTLLVDNNTFAGNNTFSSTITGSISGNAGTATALQNARTINGVSFDGTANITISAASSSLLANNNTWTGLNVFANSSSTLATLGTTWLSGLTHALLSTNAHGQIVATTTIGTSLLSGTLATVNGTAITAGGTAAITAASSTLLGDNNSFSGNNTFLASIKMSNSAGKLDFYRTDGTTYQGFVGLTNADFALVSKNSGDWLRIGANDGPIAFFPNNTAETGSSPQFIMTETGRFGIGTTSPWKMLSVAGDIIGTNITATGTLAVSNLASFSGGMISQASSTFTGFTQFANASTTQLTNTGATYLTSITNGLLSTNAAGQVVATSSIGANLITGSLGTINGTTFDRGSSITVTAASSTLLANNNTWTGLNQFSNASTTLLSGTTAWFTSFVGSLTGNASTATALQTGRTINGTLFDGTSDITITAASSTLLANNNTFSGANTFSSTITGSISGNAGTATALQTPRTINGVSFDGTSNITITAASSTLLADSNWFTGTNRFTNASTSQLTATSTVYFTSLAASSLLGLDANNRVVATTSIGSNLITGSLGTINGTTFDRGSSITVSAASSTLLANSNTWTGLNQFANSTTSLATLGTTWMSGITNALLSTNASGQVVATTTIGTSLLSGTLATVNGTAITAGGSATITAASSTLLANNNTFSGANTFTQTITGSISGNAGTATALQTARNINGTSFNGTADITITAASSSLLADSNWFTGTNRFTNASTSQLTATSTVYFTSLAASSLLGLDANNRVVATSSIGANLITGSLGTINGTTFDRGSSITVTAASSTLLTNNNSWTGLNQFANASTTLLSGTTAWFTTINGSLVGNASTATALQTPRTINGVSFDGTANITITAASSTLLANNNTWSGLNTFANSSSTLTTLGITWLSGITNALLSTNAAGQVSATTSIGTNYLTGTLATVNGTAITAGGSATITAASSTLLANNNTFSGTNAFALLSAGTTTITSLISTNTSSSTFAGGLQMTALNVTGTATSTFNRGINLTGGCFSINGTCVGGTGGSLIALGTGWATTTATSITFATTTLSFNGLTLGQRITAAAGSLTFTPTVSGTLDNSGLTNSTISGIALGEDLSDLTTLNTSLTISGTGSYNGSAFRSISLTPRAINGTTFDGTGDITITAASSTLLADNNMFSGNTTFLNSIKMSDSSGKLDFYRDDGTTYQGFVGLTNTDFTIASKNSGDWFRIGAENAPITFFPDGSAESGSTYEVAITTSGLEIGTNGVRLSDDNDGALTFLGIGTGADEDLTINFDDTPNRLVLTSSTGVDTLQFSGIGLLVNASSTFSALANLANASSSFTTLGTTWFTGIQSSLLSTNANGQVVSTSSIGTNYLTGTLATVNGTAITAGGSATITAASSTLLANNNTFSGNNIFSAPLSLTSTSGTTTIASGQGFTIGGSQFLVQQGSGRVGIGTTSPIATFAVAGGVSTPTAGDAPTALFVQGGIGSDSLSLGDIGFVGGALELYGGRGGIGLGVGFGGTGGAGGSIYIAGGQGGTGDTLGAGGAVVLAANRAGTQIGTVGVGTTTPGALLALQSGTAASTTVQFTSWVSGSSTPSFMIASANNNGFIGIGTSTPGTLLSIHGVANFSTGTSTIYSQLALRGSATTTSIVGINLSGGCFAVNGVCVGSGSTAASSTLLADSNWWTGTNRFTNASTSQLTATSTIYFTGLAASSLLALDNNNRVVATSTIGTNLLSGTIATINGTTIAAGGTVVITAASSTLLANNNSWTGLNQFANSTSTLATITRGWATTFSATYASSTALTVSGNTYLTSLASAVLGVDATGRVVATSSIGTTLLSGTLATVNGTAISAGGTATITAASSTLLADNNTFSATNVFSSNVAIGFAVPSFPLHIASTSAGVETLPLHLHNDATSNGTGVGISFGNTNVNNSSTAKIVNYRDATSDRGLAFSTYDGSSTAERFRITGAGNVGIGTTSPAAKFSVSGNGYFTGSVGIGTAAPGQALTLEGSAPIAEIRSGGYLMLRPAANDWDMRLQAVSGNKLNIWSGGDLSNPIATFVHGGNVGIGTTTPDSKMVLSGAGAYGTLKIVGEGNGQAVIGMRESTVADGGVGNWVFGPNAGNLTSGVFSFWTGGLGNVMTMTTGGNVGIGTTTPESGLSIQATDSWGNLHLNSSTANGGAAISFKSADDANGSVGQWLMGKNMGGATNDNFSLYNGTGGYVLTALTSGNVGIGTTTPGTLLSVQGVANFTTATSTFNGTGGINLVNGGCFAVNGTCLSSGSSFSNSAQLAALLSDETGSGSVVFSASPTFTGTPIAPNLDLDNGAADGGNLILASSGFSDWNLDNFSGALRFYYGATEQVRMYNNGGMSIGNTYAATTPPNDGLLVEGNVGIGATVPLARLGVGTQTSFTNNASSSVISDVAGLPSTADAFRWVSEFRSTSGGGNTERLLIGEHRLSAGSDWTTTAWRIQPAVDNSFTTAGSNRGYLEFDTANKGIRLSGQGNITPDMVLNGSGNVGIGTTTPWGRLAVSAAANSSDNQFVVASSTAVSFLVNAQGQVGIGTSSPAGAFAANTSLLSVGTIGTNSAYFAGRVAIGQSNPAAALHVHGTGGVQEYITTNGNNEAALWFGNNYGGSVRWAAIGMSGTDGALRFTGGNSSLGDADTHLTITDTGRVGVGTTSPSTLLSLGTSGNTIKLATWDNGSTLYGIGIGSGMLTFGAGIAAAGTPQMMLNSSGSVGIGTTTPSTKLSIANGQLSIDNTSTAASIQLSNSGVTHTYIAQSFGAGEWSPGSVAGDLVIRGQGTNMLFTTDSGSNTQLYLKNGGNIGIGTTSPTEKLSVLSADDSASTNILAVRANNLSQGIGIWYAGIRPVGSNGSNSLYLDGQTSGNILMQTSGSGNVGIGTTTPWQKLSVSGKIVATDEITGVGSGTGQFRAVSGGSGMILRNDSSNTYFLFTNSGDAYGSWNSLRPLTITNASGNVSIGDSALTVAHGGNVNIDNNLTFSDANPVITSGSSYITIPNGLYVSGGTPYFQTQAQFRAGIHNDTGTYLEILGGTSGDTYFSSDVGIGTSSPAGRLNIESDTVGNTTETVQRWGWNDSSWFLDLQQQHVSGSHIQWNFVDQSNNNLLAFRNGNVGIGTTSPGALLEIASSNAGGGVLRISNSGSSQSAGEALGSIEFYNSDASSGALGVRAFITPVENDGGTGRSFDLTFGTGDATAATEKVRITKAGNLGIGTTTPQSLLTVNAGTANAFQWHRAGTVGGTINGNNGAFHAVTSSFFQWSQGGTDYAPLATNAHMTLRNGILTVGTSTPTTGGHLNIWGKNGANSYLMVTNVDSANNGSTPNGDIFIINGSGRVGVATTTPFRFVTVGTGDGTQRDIGVFNGAICADNGGNTKCYGTLTAGVVYGDSSSFVASDVAENYPTSDPTLVAGDIVALDGVASSSVRRAIWGDRVFGIISTAPGVLLGDETGTSSVPVALVGRVPVKVTLENGPIRIGDALSLSAQVPSAAKKAVAGEQTIGFALENYSSEIPTRLLLTFVQQGYAGVDSLLSIVSSDQALEGGSFAAAFLGNLLARISGWLADAGNGITDFFANRVHTKELCIGDQDGNETCLTKAQLDALLAGAGSASGGGSPQGSGGGGGGEESEGGGESGPDTEAPVIIIQGANPAEISVGTTYADLGATATDNVDQNLSIKASVDGGELIDLSAVTIDTSAPGSHTILYSVTDQAGNTATMERTILISAPAPETPEEPTP